MVSKHIPRDARVSRKRSSVAVHLMETVNYLDSTFNDNGSTATDQGSPTSSRSNTGSQSRTPGSRFSPTLSSQARSSTVDLSQEEWDGGMSPALKAKLLSPITASKKIFRKFGRNSSGTLVNNDSPTSPSFASSPLSQSSPATISERSNDSDESSPAEPHPPMHTRPATPRPFRASLAVSPPRPSLATASSSVYSQDDGASVRSWQTESSSHTHRAVASNDPNDIENTEIKDFGAAVKPEDETPPSSVEPDSIFSLSPRRSTTGDSHHIRNKSALPPPLTIRKVSTPTTASFSIPPLPAAPSLSTSTVGLGIVHPAFRDGSYTPTRDTTGGAERDYFQVPPNSPVIVSETPQVPPNSPVIVPRSPPTCGVWDSIVEQIVNIDATVSQNNTPTLTQRLLAVLPAATTTTDCGRSSFETIVPDHNRPISQITIRGHGGPAPQRTIGGHERGVTNVERPSCIPSFYTNSPGSDESNPASDLDTDTDTGADAGGLPTNDSHTAARPARNTIQGLPGPHRPTIVTPAHKHTPQTAEVIVPASVGSLNGSAPTSMQRSQTAQPSGSQIHAPAATSPSLIARRVTDHAEAVRAHSLASYSSTETIRALANATTRSSQETLRAVPAPTTPQKLIYDASSGTLGVESRSTPGRLSSITATHPAFCGDLFESPAAVVAGGEQVALDRDALEAQLREISPTRIPSRVSLKKGEQVTPDLPSEPFRGLPSRFSDSSVEEGDGKRGFRQRVGLGGKVGGGGKAMVKGGAVGGKVGGEGRGTAPIKGGLVAEMRKRYA